MPTQAEYNVTKQQQRELYVKINLLNFKFQIVDELSGVLLSDSFWEKRPWQQLVPLFSSITLSYHWLSASAVVFR